MYIKKGNLVGLAVDLFTPFARSIKEMERLWHFCKTNVYYLSSLMPSQKTDITLWWITENSDNSGLPNYPIL